MKPLLIAALCLACAHTASAECAEVTPYNWSLTPLPSSGNAQITVNLDGKPLPNATLIVNIVTKNVEQFLLSALADAHGVAQLRELKPGRYHVVGMSPNDIRSDLLLDVSRNSQKPVRYFSLDMFGRAESTRHFALAQTDKMPVSEDLSEFPGTVQDQSGASIPKAEVEIYPDGTVEQTNAVNLRADEGGHFSAKLPDGVYRAIIHMAESNPIPWCSAS
jgi:hypothetical protein